MKFSILEKAIWSSWTKLGAVALAAVRLRIFRLPFIYHTMNLRPLERKALTQVKTYIDEHYREDITVNLLCDLRWQNDQVVFRPRRLHDAFADHFLQTIHEYQIRLRMEKAKCLLETTDLSVKAIAISVGYRADGSFGSAFRKHVGVTPSSYRTSLVG
jgi:AraC-like DNA-binding protein